MIPRSEHVQWSKRRALQYLDAGDLVQALASFASDMSKRTDTKLDPRIAALGLHHGRNGDADGLRRWIEGFQ